MRQGLARHQSHVQWDGLTLAEGGDAATLRVMVLCSTVRSGHGVQQCWNSNGGLVNSEASHFWPLPCPLPDVATTKL